MTITSLESVAKRALGAGASLQYEVDDASAYIYVESEAVDITIGASSFPEAQAAMLEVLEGIIELRAQRALARKYGEQA